MNLQHGGRSSRGSGPTDGRPSSEYFMREAVRAGRRGRSA
jgi:hypothetical protein